MELILEFGYPVHILTKSVLAERNLGLLKQINGSSKAVLSTSISTADDDIARRFEPGASPPSERLAIIRRAKQEGLSAGVYLLPLIPFITDHPEMIDGSFRAVKETGADFIIFGNMTLMDGRQKEHFLRALSSFENETDVKTDGISGSLLIFFYLSVERNSYLS